MNSSKTINLNFIKCCMYAGVTCAVYSSVLERPILELRKEMTYYPKNLYNRSFYESYIWNNKNFARQDKEMSIPYYRTKENINKMSYMKLIRELEGDNKKYLYRKFHDMNMQESRVPRENIYFKIEDIKLKNVIILYRVVNKGEETKHLHKITNVYNFIFMWMFKNQRFWTNEPILIEILQSEHKELDSNFNVLWKSNDLTYDENTTIIVLETFKREDDGFKYSHILKYNDIDIELKEEIIKREINYKHDKIYII